MERLPGGAALNEEEDHFPDVDETVGDEDEDDAEGAQEGQQEGCEEEQQ